MNQWNWRVVAGLLALWVVEQLAVAGGLPVQRLAWSSSTWTTAPWQLVTWPLINGRSVFGVLIGLYILGTLLPAAVGGYGPRDLRQLGLWTVTGGLLAGVVTSLLTLATGLPVGRGVVMGWTLGFAPLFALFGLRNPTGVVNIWFVLPVSARWFVWLSGGLPAMMWLVGLAAGNTLSPAVTLGLWGGTMAWFHRHRLTRTLRRRTLTRQAREVEHQLRLVKGGRDDDTWH